eukprot:GILJ01017747.1.p1 GENE.GILJ01017747.1~~GILJ01017747.1.p1  ORF type:complete len:336 (+),score=58.25 GILJ01017747.1:148-1155(+)
MSPQQQYYFTASASPVAIYPQLSEMPYVQAVSESSIEGVSGPSRPRRRTGACSRRGKLILSTLAMCGIACGIFVAYITLKNGGNISSSDDSSLTAMSSTTDAALYFNMDFFNNTTPFNNSQLAKRLDFGEGVPDGSIVGLEVSRKLLVVNGSDIIFVHSNVSAAPDGAWFTVSKQNMTVHGDIHSFLSFKSVLTGAYLSLIPAGTHTEGLEFTLLMMANQTGNWSYFHPLPPPSPPQTPQQGGNKAQQGGNKPQQGGPQQGGNQPQQGGNQPQGGNQQQPPKDKPKPPPGLAFLAASTQEKLFMDESDVISGSNANEEAAPALFKLVLQKLAESQ